MNKSTLLISAITLSPLPRFAPVEISDAPTPNKNWHPSANGKTGIAAARRTAKKRRRAK